MLDSSLETTGIWLGVRDGLLIISNNKLVRHVFFFVVFPQGFLGSNDDHDYDIDIILLCALDV